MLCTHEDDLLFGGTNIIAPISFKYLGLKVSQTSTEIFLDQIDYIDSLGHIYTPSDWKRNKRLLFDRRG